ncbi:MAG: methionyl-tRNA formyltransferase [Dehalococcoidia bacterium]|nr:methionyl-tRNA formyltransferase [Dehalococcoidia bacterium]
MRIVVIGQAQFGHDVLKELLQQGKNVVGVSTPLPKDNNDNDPLSALAKENQLPNIYTKLLKKENAKNEFIETMKPDLIVFAFVNDIIPKEIIDAATIGAIQYHPSLLPKHRGRSAMNWSIVNGEDETGLSIFWVDQGIDTGPIILQESTAIGLNDSVGTLYFNTLYPLGIATMMKAITLVENNAAPSIIQDESLATYEEPFEKKHAKINWSADIKQIHNLIRGSDPQPGAYCNFMNDSVQLYQSKIIDRIVQTEKPGTIIEIENTAVVIAGKNGSIKINKVRKNGESKINASDLLNIGDTLQ